MFFDIRMVWDQHITSYTTKLPPERKAPSTTSKFLLTVQIENSAQTLGVSWVEA